MTLARSSFRAMNTEIAVLSPTAGRVFEDAVEKTREIFDRVESHLSRFRPDSELSVLNRSGGTSLAVSPLLFHAISTAIAAAHSTDGLFDPTILPALEAAGYDRSFERISAGTVTRETAVLPNYRTVMLDDASWTVRLEPGQRLDLGGIGKGLAVDLALEATAFLPDRCINAGGDIAVRGTPDMDTGWTVELEDPGIDAAATVLVHDAAVATSTIRKRRWSTGDEERHHLIDPRTGRSSESPFRTVTVVAVACAQADVAAKTALLMGESGIAFLEERGLHGIAVRRDGSTVSTSRWPGR